MGLITTVVYVVNRLGEGWSDVCGSPTDPPNWLAFAIVLAVSGALLAVAGWRWIGFMKGHKEATECGTCGYDLRNLGSPTAPCPECGASGEARLPASCWSLEVSTLLSAAREYGRGCTCGEVMGLRIK